MRQQLIPAAISSLTASLCALALTLGSVAGCGTAPDETPVGAVKQTWGEPYDEPFDPQFGTADPCNASQRAELLANVPSDDEDEIEINCSLTLEPSETITRRLRFRGGSDGVILDCQDQLRPRDPQGNMLVPAADGVMRPGASISRNGRDVAIVKIHSCVGPNCNNSLVKDEAGFYVGERPENIIIQNCMIQGSVSIAGLQGRFAKNVSSHDAEGTSPEDIEQGRPSHVDRARAIAPTNILFRRVILIAAGSTPLYVHDGVTRFTMIDSITRGRSGTKPGIYFDQESAENTILNSTLSVVSHKAWPANGREQVAIDASSYNFMVGNRVSGLNNGGYHVYRNCGEHGTIRYSTPSYNVIVNNQFVYRNFSQPRLDFRERYAVHLSQRNGPYWKGNDYCDSDLYPPEVGDPEPPDPFPWPPDAPFPHPDLRPRDFAFPADIDTSFKTRSDNAHDNIVTNNELLNRSFKHYMKNSSSLYNFTAGNREVREFSSGTKACYSPLSFGRVLLHGNTETVRFPVFVGEVPFCARATCNDGVLETVGPEDCPEPGTPIPVECRVTQHNDGCYNILSCPLGQRVKSVKAACNLELESVTDLQLAQVPSGNVRVVRRSDSPADGTCYVLGATVSEGTRPITVNPDVRTVNIGCREKDSNGGDCHVRAEFTCE